MTMPRAAVLFLSITSVVSVPLASNVPVSAAAQSQRSAEQIAWLEEHALPFDTVEAGSGFDDLMPLKELVGDARIVALGEPTHGSREVFQMKHRLVEFLAAEMGFSIFSIEANMPEAFRVNDYVARGEGDPAELIGGMYFWTWNTEEVLAMVEWMRQFNASGAGRIDFTGFDMQTPDVAARIVRDFVGDVDPDYLAELTEAYARAARARRRGAGSGIGLATFPIEAARGKTVTYRGSIKTDELTEGWAGLWWRVDGPDGPLAFDNMQDRGPRGTTDWTDYEITLEVPAEAVNINFGVIMPGHGTAWFDGLAVELDGIGYDGGEAFDFDFESDRLRGFTAQPSATYRVELDRSTAASGEQSLRIAYIPAQEGSVPADEAVGWARAVVDRLSASRGDYLQRTTAAEVDWAIQNARVVLQQKEMLAAGNQGGRVRDRAMADNVAWILQQNPDARIILWAHNGHVARQPGWMGEHLDRTYGDAQLVFGFATHGGRYYAVSRDGRGRGDHELQAPPADSIEAALHDTGLPRLILDLRDAAPGTAASGWLTEPILIRSIGAMEMDQQFFPRPLAEQFDALIYIERTTAAIQIGAR